MWSQAVWFGGAIGLSISADYQITLRRNRIFTFNPSASGWKVKTPDARKLSVGHAIFLIVNEHASRTLVVADSAATTIVTLSARQAIILNLADNTTAAGVWYGTAVSL